MEVEKTLVNKCGHTVWYRIRSVPDGIDIDSDINSACEECVREDKLFKAAVAEMFKSLFEG
jgi:hypothetical protein